MLCGAHDLRIREFDQKVLSYQQGCFSTFPGRAASKHAGYKPASFPKMKPNMTAREMHTVPGTMNE